MGEEYERRLQLIVKKLSHTPSKSKPNANNSRLLGVQKLIGKTRRNLYSSSSNVVAELGSSLSTQVPSCRPWDRDDLFRRLSTFKSMTWFAKPQIVSPVNCARRGWVNVDADTIACASCGARLLFTAPSAWTRQQVEKAALVFSLKLESGHKLLCPWINNGCTEELAHFPIAPQTSLIEDYRKRSFALSQLTALPIISPTAIDNMKSPELQQFLGFFLTSGYDVIIESAKIDSVSQGDAPESVSSYYQAQKLISLCGWEPHILPYVVDLKDGQKKYVKDANVRFKNGEKQKIDVQTLYSEGNVDSCELKLDPNSAVLDCKLCGASVGLWAFLTISRPMEYLRVVGHTEVHGKSISGQDEVCGQEMFSSNEIHTENTQRVRNTVATASPSSGFSIAGGPPPEMLNYSATITLPVIGQSLRARFLAETNPKDHSSVQRVSQVEDQQMSPQNVNLAAEEAFAATEPDLTANNPLEAHLTVGEGSILIDSPDVGHRRFDLGGRSCSTSELYMSRNGGGSEPNTEGIVEQHRTNLQGEDRKLPSFLDLREFDPIKQHRHFCPWIVAIGKFTPGWKQTLNALLGQREPSNFSLEGVASSSLIEVDDPVESVRKLFASPTEKRTKLAGGS